MCFWAYGGFSLRPGDGDPSDPPPESLRPGAPGPCSYESPGAAAPHCPDTLTYGYADCPSTSKGEVF